ncbi:MAG: bifunctional phosphopantothenoylcysteine decarboxylase/phosphopantothenate--cysteine ligase CoaBC [Eubacterium sp.]|nr:bifunctional phosphopantothenoylcysteine decarboxylase/phosphopantothenate--cysteine ligase CoaBC [Eubacterium sp.]
MLEGVNVLLGITGSIAAYKMAGVASALKKMNCNVDVIMTKNATEFITPMTFETLTHNRCVVDTFDRNYKFDVEHISLAKKADVVLVAPASANIIGKMACGIADDMLSTTLMACKGKILVAPAMNTAMYENPIVQENIQRLKNHGIEIIEPATGLLACEDVGKGKLPDEEELIDHIISASVSEKDLLGKRVLVTAGGTREPVDPVRVITNHSTGKMGYAIAQVARDRGAEVTLVSAPTNLRCPTGVKRVDVVTAGDMFDRVTEISDDMDIIVKAAAVADYTPKSTSDHKIKKSDGEMSIELMRTKDILKYLGENKKPGQILCGFSMETENLIENSQKKLVGKNVDLVVANNLNVKGAGFAGDTNVVTIVKKDGIVELPCMSKREVAYKIFDVINELKKDN